MVPFKLTGNAKAGDLSLASHANEILKNVVALGKPVRVRGGEGQGMIAPPLVAKDFPSPVSPTPCKDKQLKLPGRATLLPFTGSQAILPARFCFFTGHFCETAIRPSGLRANSSDQCTGEGKNGNYGQ